LVSYLKRRLDSNVTDDWLARASYNAHEAEMMKVTTDAQRLAGLHHYRGRQHGRLNRLPKWCAVCSQSAPAYHRGHHDLDWRLGLHISTSGWVSPAVPQAGTPPSECLNNYDLHQLEQGIRVAEVDHLRLRVESLELEQGRS
jgi:hypothetical protein